MARCIYIRQDPEHRARCSGFRRLQISGLEFRAELRVFGSEFGASAFEVSGWCYQVWDPDLNPGTTCNCSWSNDNSSRTCIKCNPPNASHLKTHDVVGCSIINIRFLKPFLKGFWAEGELQGVNQRNLA